MRFVIQNYNILIKTFLIVPKFKNYLFLKNLQFFFLFYKNYYFFFHFGLNIKNELIFYFLFYRYFFFKIRLLLTKHFAPHLVGYYSNNLIKSFIFFNLFFWNFFLYDYKTAQSSLSRRVARGLELTNDFSYNVIYVSYKTINTKMKKTIYNSVFFFLFLFSTLIWYAHSNIISFYLNFFLINFNFYLIPFFSGYFLPTYNS